MKTSRQKIMSNLFKNFSTLTTMSNKMLLKINFLGHALWLFKTNLGTNKDEDGECFHAWKRNNTRANGAAECWLTTVGHCTRHKNKNMSTVATF